MIRGRQSIVTCDRVVSLTRDMGHSLVTKTSHFFFFPKYDRALGNTPHLDPLYSNTTKQRITLARTDRVVPL